MKIRNGFVSNSSSTSFAIYGSKLNFNIDVDFLIHLYHNDEERFESYRDEETSFYLDKIERLSEKETKKLNEILEDSVGYIQEDLPDELEMHYCDGMWYIGTPYYCMDLYETRKQFEKRIKKQIKKFLGKAPNCDYYEKTYYC